MIQIHPSVEVSTHAEVGDGIWIWNHAQLCEGAMVRYVFPRFEPLRVELQGFINAIKNGTPPRVNGEDSLVALHLGLLLLESGMDHLVKEISYENCIVS